MRLQHRAPRAYAENHWLPAILNILGESVVGLERAVRVEAPIQLRAVEGEEHALPGQ